MILYIDPNIGSLLFQTMWRRLREDAATLGLKLRGLVFEVDHPDTNDIVEQALNTARIRFYENQGAVLLPMDFIAPPFWTSPEHHEITYKLMVKSDGEHSSEEDYVIAAMKTILCNSELGYKQPRDTAYLHRSLATLHESEPKEKHRGNVSGQDDETSGAPDALDPNKSHQAHSQDPGEL